MNGIATCYALLRPNGYQPKSGYKETPVKKTPPKAGFFILGYLLAYCFGYFEQ